MMNAEVTAENRPACGPVSACTLELDAKLTKMRVVFKSSSYFSINSRSYSPASFR